MFVIVTPSGAAHWSVFTPTFSPHLAKSESCVCVLFESLATAFASVTVSLSWWMCFVHDSDCVSGCACASWFYKSYLPAADVKYSFLLRFEPSDLGRRRVLTCPGDILNDWKFFLSTWRVFAYLSLGRGYTWSFYILWQLAAVIEVVHWLPQWLTNNASRLPSKRDLCFGLVNHPLSLPGGALLPLSSPRK